MVTEDVLQENIVAAVKAGLNAYVIKPVEVNNFAKKIEKKQEECKLWWNQYKNELQEFIKKKLSDE